MTPWELFSGQAAAASLLFCMVCHCCIYISPLTLSLYFLVCLACIFFWSSPSCWSVTAIPSVYSFDFVSRHILEGSSLHLSLSLVVVHVLFTLCIFMFHVLFCLSWFALFLPGLRDGHSLQFVHKHASLAAWYSVKEHLLFDVYESCGGFLGPCSVQFVSFFWSALSCSAAFWYAYCLFFCQFHQPPPSVWPAGPLNMLLPILLQAFLLLRPLVVHVMVVFFHRDIGNLYICKHSGYSANRFSHSHFDSRKEHSNCIYLVCPYFVCFILARLW
jgi:hypothetical protein